MNTTSGNVRFGKAVAWALAVVLMLLLWLPMLAMPFESTHRYGAPPAKFPTFEWSLESFISYPVRLQAWFETRFGFRASLIRAHSLMCYHILRVSPNPKVVFGKEGWMFYNGDPANNDYSPLESYRATDPLTLSKLETIRWMIQDQAEWLADRGIKYLFVLVPSKPLIHPEFLPSSVVRGDNLSDAEMFVAHMASNPELPFLDLTGPLREALAEREVCIKTDSHWNDFGAFIGTRTILERLDLPGATPKSLHDYDIEAVIRTNGDLLRMTDLTGVVQDEFVTLIPRFTPQSLARAVSDDEMADVLAGTGDPGQPVAIVYRDSFSNRLIPFLSESFRSVRYSWARAGTHMSAVKKDQPAAVLQILSDRTLRLDLRHSPAMQAERAQIRFAQSTNTLLQLDADALAALPARPGEAFSSARDSLAFQVHHNEPAITLPVIPHVDTHLPVIRVEGDAPARGGITIQSSRAEELSSIKLLESLRAGSNIVYFTIVDPHAAQPFTLSIGGNPGVYRIRSVEVRAIPR